MGAGRMKEETVEEFLARGGKITTLPPAMNDQRYAIHDSRMTNNKHSIVSYRIVRQNIAALAVPKKTGGT